MRYWAILLVLAVIFLGCTQQSEQPVTTTPTTTVATTPVATTPATTTQFSPQFGVKYSVKVVEVIDGDTIDAILPDGSKDRVRMLCVDTPETSAERNKPYEYDAITDLDCLEYWGKQAKAFAYNTLQGKTVQIEFDETAGLRGYYGRLLAYVYVDSTDFTAELVKRGYARVYEEGECKKEAEYLSYQQQAMQSNLSLWSCRYAVTTTIPTPAAVTTSKAVKIKTIHYDACGDADDRECLNDEYVVLENTGSVAVNMQGWILKDEANHRFEFPYFILNLGKTVTVHTGKGSNTATDLYWNRGTAVWNNDHDTAYLYDSSGNLIDSYSY